MSIQPDQSILTPNAAVLPHPRWCDQRLCTPGAYAEHRQTPAVMSTIDRVEVGVSMYRLDEDGEDVLPTDYLVEVTVTDRSAAQPPSIRLLLAPDEVEAIVGALLQRSLRVAAERRAVAR